MANVSFYKRFGLDLTLEEAKEKFVIRINENIFLVIKENLGICYDDLFQELCKKLPINSQNDALRYRNYTLGCYSFKGLEYLTNGNFNTTLRVLQKLYSLKGLFPVEKNGFNLEKLINYCLNESIDEDGINLGISFKNGQFIPKGDDQLDQDILSKSLDNLEGSKAKKIWKEALEEYLKGDYDDALGKCFTTLDELFNEKFGKKFSVIFKSKTISEELGLEKELTKYWDGLESNIGGTKTIERGIIQNLYVYLNEYSSRHANEGKYNINEIEVEATLYLTGVIINLVTKSTL